MTKWKDGARAALITWLEMCEEMEEEDTMLEALAELEHDQWVSWAKNIIESETITPERTERWKEMFVPYADLSEEDKDKDREWARKVMTIINGSDK